MSNTRRHKLSPLQQNLSNFLYITDLDNTIHKNHLIYMDKIYTNNKIDPDLHENIYNIHRSNYRNFILLKKDIENIDRIISNLSETNTNTNTNIRTQKLIEYNLKKLEYLNNKLLNLTEQSMSPKVIIFLLRNQIFSLEIEKLMFEQKKEDRNKDYLSRYNRINLEVSKLITEQSNIENKHNFIIDALISRVKNLELEITSLEKNVEDGRTEINKNRIKTSKNLSIINRGKSKKEKKKLEKETGYKETLLANEMINHQINLQEQQIKIKKLETKDVLYELDLKQKGKNDVENTTTKIETKNKELAEASLNLKISNQVLDQLNAKIDLINNFSFSPDLVNTINNRKRNKKNISLNKDKQDFVSKK
jgi:hypothetical protein